MYENGDGHEFQVKCVGLIVRSLISQHMQFQEQSNYKINRHNNDALIISHFSTLLEVVTELQKKPALTFQTAENVTR